MDLVNERHSRGVRGRIVCRAPWTAIFALGLFACAPVWAQLETGEIRLSVTDPSGLPLPSSSGAVSSEASNTQRTFTTDDQGRFTFAHLPFGVYRVTVEHSGFEKHSELVDVRSAIPHELKVQMALQPTVAEVNVSDKATLLDAHRAGVVYSVGSRLIQEEQAAQPGRSILDLVNMQPGWIFEANGVLHPRGAEYQTLFVVDGVPMDENRSPGFAPEFDRNDVQSISVLTGTYPAEYGRKLGGVVEVTTDKDIRQGFHGAAEASGGSFDTGGGFFSGSYGRNRSQLSISAFGDRTDRYLDPPVLGNFTNSATLDGFTAVYDQDLSRADRIHLSVHRRQTRFEIPNENLQQAGGQRQNRNSIEDFGQVGWDHLLSANLLFAMRASVEDLSANLWSNRLSTPIIAAQQRGFRRSYAMATMSAAKKHHDLKFGADADYAPVTEALQYQITDPTYFDAGTPLIFNFYDRRLDREQSLFAQDTMRYGNFTLSAGLRYDHYSLVVNANAWSPRTGVAWYCAKADLLLRFSYDRVFITPARENLLLSSSPQVDVVDTTVLRIPVQPSRGNFYETGFNEGIFGKMRLDASFYRRTFDNYADDDVFLNTGIGFPISFRSAGIEGVDVKLDLPQWVGFSGFLSYSNLIGTAQLPAVGGLFLGDLGQISATGRFPITQDQRNTARARLRYQVHPRLWIASIAQYGSGLPSEADNADIPSLIQQYGQQIIEKVNFSAGRVRPNFSLDASLGLEIWKREPRKIAFQISGHNLTDRLNVINFAGLFSGTAIAPPRSVDARLRFEF
ncbi:MAG TPA: TonB-dependent receptor [Bryobacteraceae bacterium]|nr:TonB-dependent receptor [Bryobacteraceae bacterium]